MRNFISFILIILVWITNVSAYNNIENSKIKEVESLLNKEVTYVDIIEHNKEIIEKFNKLSTKEKYIVFDKIRNDNIKNSFNIENIVANAVIEDYKKKKLFVLDMNDEEINNAFLNKSKELWINTMSLTCNAPIKNFPWKIYYWVKPASSSFSTPYYYSDVMTSAWETLCDVELWFNTTRTKIYWTNSATRLLYNTYFSWVLSTRSSWVWWQSVVIWWTRMVLAWLTSYWVYSHTITWN